MLSIKKVQVVPLENYGTIVDSFNTQDDHQKNAPSLNAVENYAVAKGDFTTITSTLYRNIGETSVNTFVDLPEGYTFDNTRVITYSYQIGTATRNYSANMVVSVTYSISLGDRLYISIIDQNPETDGTYDCEVILMKIS